jgi:hypothetical protein
MRELSRAGARWSGVPMVVQRRCCGGATRRGVLGFGSAAKDRDRNVGGFGDPTYGAAEPSACGPSVERSPEISGSGAAGGAGGEERRRGGNAARWGRGNREREKGARAGLSAGEVEVGWRLGQAWPTRGKRGRGEWAAGERAGPRGLV